MAKSKKQPPQTRFVGVGINGSGDMFFKITFGYDEELIRRVKTIPGRYWNEVGSYWGIPTEPTAEQALDAIIAALPDFEYSSAIRPFLSPAQTAALQQAQGFWQDSLF